MEDSIQVQSAIAKQLCKDNTGRIADTSVNLQDVTADGTLHVTGDRIEHSTVSHTMFAPTNSKIPTTCNIIHHPD